MSESARTEKSRPPQSKPLEAELEAERLNPGQSTEGTGGAGARQPTRKNRAPAPNSQEADGISQRECIVSGIDAEEKATQEKLADRKT
jgi:hypothetical protein